MTESFEHTLRRLAEATGMPEEEVARMLRGAVAEARAASDPLDLVQAHARRSLERLRATVTRSFRDGAFAPHGVQVVVKPRCVSRVAGRCAYTYPPHHWSARVL